MSDPTCTAPRCDRPIRCRGWCVGHYNRWRKTGDVGVTPIARRHPQNPGATCSIDECVNLSSSRGLCETHRQRVKKHGTPLADIPVQKARRRERPEICAVDGCERRRSDREWCGTHYKRWTVHGDPNIDRSRVRGTCDVEPCGRPTEARGLCKTHSDRMKRSGDVGAHVPIEPGGWRPQRQCVELGCTDVGRIRGRCRKHYGPMRKQEILSDPVRLAAHKESVRKTHQRWVAANPVRNAELQRLWRFNNPVGAKAGDRRRYARFKAALHIPFTYEQLMARMRYWGNQCWVCGGPFEAIDHVKPISKGGAHALMNFRPICKSDNSSKKDRWPFPVRAFATPALG